MEIRIIFWLFVLGALISILFSPPAHSANIASLTEGDVTITLTDEPCTLKEVKNLPNKATWTEKGKTFNGCAGGHPLGLIMLYFEDKTMVVAPVSVFQKLTQS